MLPKVSTVQSTSCHRAAYSSSLRTQSVRCACHNSRASHCSKDATPQTTSRRDFVSLFLALSIAAPFESQAIAPASSDSRRGLSRYIKRKRLDSLDSYIPALIAARQQLEQAGETMRSDVEEARSLLRSGVFSGLRDNVRAVGEYAEQNGSSQTASTTVNEFFAAVQAYDFTLFQAKRYNQPVKEDSDQELAKTLESLDRLLATVPPEMLAEAKKVVKAATTGTTEAAAGDGRQLDKLLDLVPGSGT